MKSTGLWVAIALIGGLAAASGPALAADFAPAPRDGDAYSALVGRAEAGDTTVDFKALRFAWLDSAARKREPDTEPTTKAMWQTAQANDDAGVRANAEKLIAWRYSDIDAHKFRRQACIQLKDTSCSEHEHFVEFGLINSIVHPGDGKSAATAWVVADVHEEYVVMSLGGWRLKEQALINQGGHAYDRMSVVTEDGHDATLWFDVTVAMAKEFPGLG